MFKESVHRPQVIGYNFLYLLISLSFAPSLFAQNGGDAVFFHGGSFYSAAFSPDSLDNCTVELWVFPTEAVGKGYLLYFGDNDSNGFGLITQVVAGSSGTYASVELGGSIISVTGNYTRLPLNTWTHLAFSRSTNTWKFYRNGALVGKGKRNPLIGSDKISIGKGFIGMIDEIRVWRVERTQQEILKTLSQSISATESALSLYYPLDLSFRRADSVLINKAGIDGQKNASLVVTGVKPEFPPSSISLFLTPSPMNSLNLLPSHQQFFSQNASGNATITFSGSLEEIGFDSIILKEWKNDNLINRQSKLLQYTGSKAFYNFEDSIHAELSEFTYSIYVKKGLEEHFLAESADLVAGDAFFIAGQSNAHPTVSWYDHTNQFIRTFGIQTTNQNFDIYDPSDTSWGYGIVHGWGELFGGPYLVGLWGQRMGELISQRYNIPVCLINGAAGGSTIEQNLPNDSDSYDLSTVYGRSLYRSKKSGLQKKFHALFWYQGEYNSEIRYYNNFKILYNSWLQNYSDSANTSIFKKIYLFQIHPGCLLLEKRDQLRELQRTIPNTFPNIALMSTCGVSGHDGCHYDAFGYWHIADNIYRLVDRDIYGGADTVDIDPPNIKKAVYGDSSHDLIILQFSNTKKIFITSDTIVGWKLRQLKDYFYLDHGFGNISAVIIHGDSLFLYLYTTSQAKAITYLPDVTYNNDDTDIYEGPWIMNGRGVGALSFDNIPIEPYIQDTASQRTEINNPFEMYLSCFPNPNTNTFIIAFRIPEAGPVQFDIYDLLGKKVISLGKKYFHKGENFASYNLSSLPSGEYILQMVSDSGTLVKKIIHI